MIDVEVDVFDAVFPFVTAVIPKKNFKSMFVPSPSSFPFATLMEMDNVLDNSRRSTADDEEYAILTYEANVYAESKFECREVMDALDKGMTHLGFTRLSMRFIPNLADSTLFRLTARYRAEADADKVIYRHT